MTSNSSEAAQTTSREAVVGANVRHLREAAGLSQAKLAALTAGSDNPICEMAIWSIENNRRRVRVDDVDTLAVALGVPPFSLLRPGAGSAVVHEITFDGGVTERVTADGFEVSDGWAHFYRQGQVVFDAAVHRVLGVRIEHDGDES